MPEITITAEAGRPVGSRSSSRLRAEGKIPGVVYGHGTEPLPVAVDARALRAALSTAAGLNALLELKIGSDSHLTMAKDIQRDPVRHTVAHVDFLVVSRTEVVTAEVPVAIVGEARAVTSADGVVEQQMYSLLVRATPGRIPNSLEVDVSGLEVGSTIRVGDIPLPDGVTTDVDPEQAVVIGHTPQLAAEPEAAEGAEAGEAAEEAAEESEATAEAGGADGEGAGAEEQAEA
ncbi:MAG TPA: 50S ribosomal protein L25 [Acidimicrobiales bacterium]|nr:50S ribosomal protein L25 [Acidimicrobiales bacterium]